MIGNAADLGQELAEIVKAALTAELVPLRERIAVLEARKGTEQAERDLAELRERTARLEERRPEKGEPGNDGLSVKDFDCCVLDDDRTIQFALRNGDVEHVATLKWPTVIDRGVFKAGQQYDHGDAVSFGGSMWIAQKETTAKPGDGDDWRLAVKRGRDGRDLKGA